MAEEIKKTEEKSAEREYFFPTENITITATSKEEAEAKLVEIGKKNINNKK